jgi:hypothetical protein
MTFASSIISGNNSAGGARDIYAQGGVINANFCAIGINGGFSLSGTSGNNLAFGLNLQLGALANNGGPTQTMLPASTSPVINAGSNPAGLTTDQRGPGFVRVIGSAADIGAVELDQIPPTVTALSLAFLNAPQSLVYTFSEDVSGSLDQNDLLLQNLTTSTTIPSGNIAGIYNNATNVCTFSFPGYPFGALPDGNYKATLMGAGVTDASGNPMVGDLVFNFFFITGDANRDRTVNVQDFNILAGNYNQSGRNFSQGNFNYDNTVNVQDFNILAARYNQVLPPSGAFGGASAGGAFSGSFIQSSSGSDDNDRLNDVIS